MRETQMISLIAAVIVSCNYMGPCPMKEILTDLSTGGPGSWIP